MSEVVLTGVDRWASVNSREWPYVGVERHIVARGGVTSVCGNTAIPATLWRGDRRKPMCEKCIERYEEGQ